MNTKKVLTYEEARAYIAGPEKFDPVRHEIEHIEMLEKSWRRHLTEYPIKDEMHRKNAIKTVSRYIDHHKSAPNIDLLHKLLEDIKHS
jgi:hypothetical protein